MLLNKLIWYEEYLSGIKVIDDQHKEIFESFNNFYEALNAGEVNKEVVDEFLKILDSYTTTHFGTEERLMLEYNYPKYEEHKKRHRFFISMYEELVENRFFRHTAGHLFALSLATLSGEWWETHIVTHDKELVNFLKQFGEEMS